MVAVAGRGWRLAPALEAMWREANRIAPGRSRRSDGSIGDRAHAARTSEHNPRAGFVHALDLTHDPAGGWDAHARARQLVDARDPRLSVVISNGQIWSSARAGEGWRRYTGSNPHRTHAHFEVHQARRDDTSRWWGAAPFFPTPAPAPTPAPNPRPEPEPQLEDDSHMTKLIRCSDRNHPHFGMVFAVHGLQRMPVSQADHQMYLLLAGGQAECDARTWDWFMGNTIDVSAWPAVVMNTAVIASRS